MFTPISDAAQGRLAQTAGLRMAEATVLPPMVLHLERPSKAWQAVSQYPKEQRGFTKKAVLLGSGYEAPVKFLTAVDNLVAQLLQDSRRLRMPLP